MRSFLENCHSFAGILRVQVKSMKINGQVIIFMIILCQMAFLVRSPKPPPRCSMSHPLPSKFQVMPKRKTSVRYALFGRGLGSGRINAFRVPHDIVNTICKVSACFIVECFVVILQASKPHGLVE